MLTLYRFWFVIATVVFLGGCATMSPDECKRANWMDIGQRDGQDGRTMDLLNERIADCQKGGVVADTGRYLVGRERGLLIYCRLDNAIPLGLQGSNYEGVCPPGVDAEFRRRHEAGLAVFQARNEVVRLDERLDSLERQLRDTGYDEEKRLRVTEKDEDRRRIRKEFDDRRSRLRYELSDTDRSLRRARDALRSAEYALSFIR